jgi:tetratricopeptide (TPR) repeat protein
MRPLAPRTLVALVVTAALALGSLGAAQADPQRLLVLPFDADDSVAALALATPTALQRALNEIDGVYVGPVGDGAAALQRLVDAGDDDVLNHLAEAFGAQALVLGRIVGSDAVALELVVVVDGEERTSRIEGRVDDLAGWWRLAAERIAADAGIEVSAEDRSALRAALGDAPSLPSLGPVGAASARLPGTRVDALAAAAALDEGSAWVRAELARALALAGDGDQAIAAALEAVALSATVENLATLGVVQLVLGDAAAAAASFEDALARNPNHAIALVGLAQTAAPAEQALLLARAVAAAPRQVEAHLRLAALQTSASGAIQVLRRAAERLPDSGSVLSALVDATLAAEDPRGALDLLRLAASRPLGRTPVAYAVAVRLPNAVADGALSFVREGIERFPDSAELRRTEAELLRRAGDLAGAEASLRAAVDTDPTSLTDVLALARVLAERGAGDEAQALWATVADRSADADLVSAELDLAAGRARAALATLEPSVLAGAADLDRRTLYGIALGRIGRIDEARDVLVAVVDEAPDAELATRALALLEERGRIAGDADLALSGEAAASFERGLGALEAGEFARAAEAFAAARALGDAGLLAFYEGYALQRGGDPRAAVVAYEAARAELGDLDVLLNNLGYAHLQLGRYDRALATLEAALATNPESARAHFNLGLVYYGTNRFDEAVAAFDRALAIDPSLEASAAAVIADARRRAAP